MKTTEFLAILFTSMATTVIATPNPDPNPVGIEVVERDGKTIVREVPRALLQSRGDLAPRCNECAGQGDQCTIGDGNCYKEDPPLYCTWCGDGCKSLCVRQGQACPSNC